MTGYDADGAVYEWGEADMGRIYRLCHTLDYLQSRWSGVGGAASPALSHEGGSAPNIRLKMRNLVDELHKRCSKWLCECYGCAADSKV